MHVAPDHALRDARRRARISQDELAARLDLDRSVVSRAERGYARLHADVRVRALAVCAEAAPSNDVSASTHV